MVLQAGEPVADCCVPLYNNEEKHLRHTYHDGEPAAGSQCSRVGILPRGPVADISDDRRSGIRHRTGLQGGRRAREREAPHTRRQFPGSHTLMGGILRHRCHSLYVHSGNGRACCFLRSNERLHHHGCHLHFRCGCHAQGAALLAQSDPLDRRTGHSGLLLRPYSVLRHEEQQRLFCRGDRPGGR